MCLLDLLDLLALGVKPALRSASAPLAGKERIGEGQEGNEEKSEDKGEELGALIVVLVLTGRHDEHCEYVGRGVQEAAALLLSLPSGLLPCWTAHVSRVDRPTSHACPTFSRAFPAAAARRTMAAASWNG